MTDKYCKKRTLHNWSKPLIWLSNENPLNKSKVDRDWLEANTVIVHLTHRLYKPEPVVPAMFQQPDPAPPQEEDRGEGGSSVAAAPSPIDVDNIVDNIDWARCVYLEDIM